MYKFTLFIKIILFSSLSEVAALAGVELNNIPSLGVAVGDYNNDGFDDQFVTNVGINTLFKNNGDGTFTDVASQLGLDDVAKASYAASFGDIDGDGDLDIYVGHWTEDLIDANPTNRANDLYINNGIEVFNNIAEQAGVNTLGATFAIPMTDFDHDKDLDLLVVNDFFFLFLRTGITLDSSVGELFRNDGLDVNNQLIFTSFAAEAGLNQEIQGMGVAISDYDNDGDIDYYCSKRNDGLLSANNDTGVFISQPVPSYTGAIGWGAVFIDVDNDGYVDLYRGNSASAMSSNVGSVAYQLNSFYQNNKGIFAAEDSAVQVGLGSLNAGLGVATAGFDNDGDQDIVVHGVDGTINLFRNDTVTENHSLQIALKGTASNRRGIGAKIFVVSGKGAAASKTVREVNAGSSHSSNNSFVTHIGLGSIGYASRVSVEWPSGCVQVLTNVSTGLNEIEENCTANHVVTGRITHNGNGLAGVKVWDAYDFQNTQTLTDASGVFVLQGYADTQQALIVVDGRDGFIVSSDPRRFIPSMNAKDVVLNDSIATLKANTIMGAVRAISGAGVASVNVWNIFTYPTSSVSTDANGSYVLTDINVGDNVWLNGARVGMSMVIDSGEYVLIPEGVAIENVDFTITAKANTASGFITTQSGVGINANQIWDALTWPASIVTTDINGFYIIPDMADDSGIALIPSTHPDYAISPFVDTFVKAPGAAEQHNFVATPQ
ncbi:hypothetical protein MNBD_GAMMA10-1183 [hydrothermal vent metagenome]|uniref:ASPIC/UnbV domain-containing protein n=1 Tax=hydrothermal vent metagenome TaxID=652676 RepID=A0A3B0YJ38_9ZZZZ